MSDDKSGAVLDYATPHPPAERSHAALGCLVMAIGSGLILSVLLFLFINRP
jgi:hypothetical protein